MPFRFLIAGQDILRSFPGTLEIKLAKFLRQIDRFIHHALLILAIAQLDIAGQREILTQGMAFKAIIRQHPAEVRMAGKHDAIHIPSFPLKPVGGRE